MLGIYADYGSFVLKKINKSSIILIPEPGAAVCPGPSMLARFLNPRKLQLSKVLGTECQISEEICTNTYTSQTTFGRYRW